MMWWWRENCDRRAMDGHPVGVLDRQWSVQLRRSIGSIGRKSRVARPSISRAGDRDEAERLLQGILSDEQASIESVSHIIREGRTYRSQPIGALPSEQIVVRGQTYPLSLFVPASYETEKSHALIVCLHGYGFTGEEYLERWRTRLGEEYLLACPTYPSGAWFTRRAEEVVLETIREVRRRYHIDPDRIFLTGMSNGGSVRG